METSSRITRSGSTTASQVIHKRGFADPELCKRLIEFWEQHSDLTSKERGDVRFFDNRVLHVREVHAVDERLAMQLLRLADRMANIIAETYRIAPVYPDDVQLVKWWEGHEMFPHADREHPDGSEHRTPWRSYASVIYLNEDYRGGEIYFPELGIEIAPSQGSMLAFGGSLDFLHGVRKIEHGVRYTCPSWFTHDRAHAVDLYLQRYC